jgi:hypothetical protein
VEEVAVVRDDEDGLSSERQLQDAVVLVVRAVGDGLIGIEHSATGRLCDLDEDAEVLLDGLRVPLEAPSASGVSSTRSMLVSTCGLSHRLNSTASLAMPTQSAA